MIKKIISLFLNVLVDLVLFFLSFVFARFITWKLFFGDCNPLVVPMLGPNSKIPGIPIIGLCTSPFDLPFSILLTILLFILLLVIKEKIIKKYKID